MVSLVGRGTISAFRSFEILRLSNLLSFLSGRAVFSAYFQLKFSLKIFMDIIVILWVLVAKWIWRSVT